MLGVLTLDNIYAPSTISKLYLSLILSELSSSKNEIANILKTYGGSLYLLITRVFYGDISQHCIVLHCK